MEKKIAFSIRKKALILNLFLPLLLFLAGSSVIFKVQYEISFEEKRYQMEQVGYLIRDNLTIPVVQMFQTLQGASTHPDLISFLENIPDTLDYSLLRETPGYEHIQQFFQSLIGEKPVSLLYAASENSRGFIADREPELPDWYDARERGWYTLTEEEWNRWASRHADQPRYTMDGMNRNNSFTITEPYPNAIEGEESLAITIAHILLDRNQAVRGVIAMDYSIMGIIEMLESTEKRYGIQIVLYSARTGDLIWDKESGMADPENPLTLNQKVESYGFEGEEAAVLSETITRDNLAFYEGKTRKFGASLFHSIHIPGTPWGIIVIKPKSEISERLIREIAPPLIGVGIFFLSIMTAGFLVLIRIIIRPLSETSTNLEVLSSGEGDLTSRLPVRSADELGHLSSSFNLFVSKLSDMINNIKEALDGMEEIKENILSSTEETTGAVEQIGANISSLGNQMHNLDDNLGANSLSMENISRNIENFDLQIANQAAMVEESTAAITQMIASLNNVSQVTVSKKNTTGKLGAVALEGKNQLNETSQAFKNVVENMDRIKEMANAINKIASQTNLLSMNAAIEAAHAGDSGKGFAVVAEEIRKLADSSGTSSRNITELIKQIADGITETEEKVNTTNRAFDQINNEINSTINAFSEIEISVSELNQGGQQILESSEEINNATVTIRDGSIEIKNGIQSILDSSEELKNISGRVNGASREVKAGSDEILTSMQLIMQLGTQLNDIVIELREQFGRFKT